MTTSILRTSKFAPETNADGTNTTSHEAITVPIEEVVPRTPGVLTAVQIPCCLCGVMIYPNAANQCSTCLAQQFNLQERLQRGPGGAPHTTLFQCRECRRYHRIVDKQYEHAEPESSQLLAICLKQIPALQNNYSSSRSNITAANNVNTSADKLETNTAPLHIVDAKWIWTEPHNMRLKLALTVRTELSGVPVQQRCLVEIHVAWRQCTDCQKEYRSRTWHAIVQVRQKQSQQAQSSNQSKHGLHCIEQGLRRANPAVRKQVLKVDHVKAGFDFYFMNLAHAQAFTTFVQGIVPMRIKTSHKLVSTDSKNNTAHVKHTITADVVPLLKRDLVLIHKSTPKNSLAGKLAIVVALSSGMITFQDASPSVNAASGGIDRLELSAESYYRNEKYYTVVQSSDQLSRFVVLDVEPLNRSNGANIVTQASPNDDRSVVTGISNKHPKHTLAEIEVARESDMGVTNDTFRVISHLGHILKVGDVALGYDVASSTRLTALLSHQEANGETAAKVRHNFICPDVVLIQKESHKKSDVYDDDDDDYHSTAVSHATQRRPESTTNVNESNGDSDMDDENDDNHTKATNVTSASKQLKRYTKQKRISKQKQRRQLRHEGKRKKQLEQSAIRMGFIPADGNIIEEYNSDIEDNDNESYEKDEHGSQPQNRNSPPRLIGRNVPTNIDWNDEKGISNDVANTNVDDETFDELFNQELENDPELATQLLTMTLEASDE